MAYKSLLTVLTDPAHIDAPLDQIAALSAAFDAHADALCIGVDRSPHGYYEAGGNTLILQQALEQAQGEADTILARADAVLGGAGIRWSSERAVAPLAAMGTHVASRSRFADLVVMPLPYGAQKGGDMEVAVEAALFGGRAPVLVLPESKAPSTQFKTIMVAWNEAAEAMTAVRRALPLLQSADLVRIVTVAPAKHQPDRTDPGSLMSQMLARHGVTCEIDVLSQTMPRTSDVLNRHATDTGSDMIVMGAYGHSRLREAILGGATRNMLESAKVPVLMAH